MRTLNILGALAFVLCSALSVWLWHRVREERALNAQLVAQMSSMSVSPANTDLPEAAMRTSTPPEAAAADAIPPALEDPSRSERDDTEDLYADERRRLRDPKYRGLWRERERLNLAFKRDNFIRLLGLTAAQANAVIDLAIDRQMAWIDRPPVPDPMTDEFRQASAQMDAESERIYQEGLRKLLDEQKRTQLQEYEESQQTRLNINHFRAQLTGADLLRDDQVEPLIAAVHEEEARMQREMQAYRDTLDWTGDTTATLQQLYDRELELMKAANGRMRTAVAPILSPSQLARFTDMLERKLANTAADQGLQQLQSKLH